MNTKTAYRPKTKSGFPKKGKTFHATAAGTGHTMIGTIAESSRVAGKLAKKYAAKMKARRRALLGIGSVGGTQRGKAQKRVRTLQDAAGKKAALAARLVDDVEQADGSDVAQLCETYDLKRTDLGRLTGFSLRALAEWSAGKLPSEPARRRLHEVRRLLDALGEVVKVEAIPQWLGKRNAAFDNMTPLQVIEVGEIDRLWQMVYQLGSGNPD
jgi:DNA-binding transcriptional regulator YiaG